MSKFSPVTAIEVLEQTYNASPTLASTVKESSRVTPHYRALIEASPFLLLATAGPEGLDCSPRGDETGLVHIEDDQTLIIPDRRGNNRIDSLRNIVRDPRVALLFLIPGAGTTVRVNGKAHVTLDPGLLARLAVQGKPPRSAVVVAIETIYFQCARAVLRADLWNPQKFADPAAMPTPGDILHERSQGEIEGRNYDLEWPDRAKVSLW